MTPNICTLSPIFESIIFSFTYHITFSFFIITQTTHMLGCRQNLTGIKHIKITCTLTKVQIIIKCILKGNCPSKIPLMTLYKFLTKVQFINKKNADWGKFPLDIKLSR